MAYRRREDLLSDVLTKSQVTELLRMRKNGATLQEIADHYEIHINTVRNIINRYRTRKATANG